MTRKKKFHKSPPVVNVTKLFSSLLTNTLHKFRVNVPQPSLIFAIAYPSGGSFSPRLGYNYWDLPDKAYKGQTL